jgi:hypothetical protein
MGRQNIHNQMAAYTYIFQIKSVGPDRSSFCHTMWNCDYGVHISNLAMKTKDHKKVFFQIHKAFILHNSIIHNYVITELKFNRCSSESKYGRCTSMQWYCVSVGLYQHIFLKVRVLKARVQYYLGLNSPIRWQDNSASVVTRLWVGLLGLLPVWASHSILPNEYLVYFPSLEVART